MYKKGKVMKNNVIFGLHSLEKMMKSVLFLAISLMVFSVDASQAAKRLAAQRGRGTKQQSPRAVPRNVRGQALGAQIQPQTPATPLTKGALLVNTALANNPNVKRNQLSPRAQVIVQDVEEDSTWESAWDREVAKIQNADEKKFLEDLRSVLAKKKVKLEESSIAERALKSLNAQNRQLMKEIGSLREQLAMQNKGLLGYLYESVAAAGPALGISGGSGTLAWLVGGFTLGGSAAVGISVLSLASGLSYVAEKVRTGEFTDAVAKLVGENVITQYTNDNGRYPTFDSRIDGINKDIHNISTLDDIAFENYRKTVLAQTIAKQKEAFEDPAVKESEGKIDVQIRLVRDKYFSEDPAIYMSNLEGIRNIENITQAKAIISEYLRAAFREGQVKLLEKKKAEAEQKAAEQPKKTGFWSWFGY